MSQKKELNNGGGGGGGGDENLNGTEIVTIRH